MNLHVLTTVNQILLRKLSVNSQFQLAAELCTVHIPVFKQYYIPSNLHSRYMFRIHTALLGPSLDVKPGQTYNDR